MNNKPKYKKDHNGKYREIKKESLKDSLTRLLKYDLDINVKQANYDDKLKEKWTEIVGEKIANISTVKTSKSGILVVEANNSVVLQELKMMGDKYLIHKFKLGDNCYAFKKINYKLKK